MFEHLSIEEITKIIMQYIIDKNGERAIFIDGEWGIGKTYFVDNILIPEIQKNNGEVVKISLYGIKKEEDLYNQIYLKMMEKSVPKKLKKDIITKCGKTLGKAYQLLNKNEASAQKEFFQINLPPIGDIVELINVWANLENYVIIFDDFERCEIVPHKILGIINNFITQKKCKCVIVGNEKELNKIRNCDNLENKYLVALNQDLKIENNIEENNKKAYDIKNTVKNDQKFEIDELKKRIEILFAEDIEYNVVKEKVIGRTIFFTQDLNDVIKNIMNSKIYKNFDKEVILSNINEVKCMFKEKEHNNIRTVISALENFNRIMRILNNINIEKDSYYEETIKEILIYTVYATIKNKITNKIHISKKDYEYEIIDSPYRIIATFKFVDKFISLGVLNGDDVEKAFKQYVEIKRSNVTNKKDPLNALMGYWELEDDIVNERVNGLINQLRENQYNIALYSKIISLLIKIKNIGFDNIIIDDITNIMIKNIEQSEVKKVDFDNFFEFGYTIDSESEKKEFEKYMEPLRKQLTEKKSEESKAKIDKIFQNEEDWGEKIADYYHNNDVKILNSRKFVKDFNIDRISNLLNESNSLQIAYFRRTINSVYKFSNVREFYEDDYEKLVELSDRIRGILCELEKNNNNNTKKFNIKCLNEDLNNILSKFKDE